MDDLISVRPDGSHAYVPNTYEGIKRGLDEATISFVKFSDELGCYIDDEGLLNGLALNVPVSIMFARVLYGPAVICRGDTDGEGNTLVPDERVALALADLAERWKAVRASAEATGQQIDLYGDHSTLPPPVIIGFKTQEEFERYLATGEAPDE